MSNFIGVRHVGWGVKDPVALAAFYREMMGMTVVRQTPADSPIGTTVFLSRHPGDEEDHDLVFFPNPMFAHTAFRVASLAELRTFYREMKERGVPIKMTMNHGLALSLYFEDPEGHMIEIYWLTHVPVHQNFYALPIDLDRPEEALLREVERVTGQAPSTSR
jgi:catechol 2,3-dioxygenase